MSYTFTSGQILTAADLNAVIAQTASTGTNASSLATGTVAESVLPYRMNQNVTTTSNVTFANVVITGNLTVQGVTTSINTANLDITDLNITVGKNAANSLQANGGGLTIAGANAQFYYNDTSNNMILNLPISIGNATGNATLSSINLNVNGAFIANTTGAYHTGTINAASHTVGATFTANATLVNAAAINITGQVNTATMYATTTANVGANVQANTTALFIGNSTVNSTISAGNLNVNGAFIANNSGAYHSGTVNAASHTIGTTFIANTTGAYHTGTINAASHTTTNSVVNTSQISIGTVNSTSNGVVANTTAIIIGNSSVSATINSTAFSGTVLSANNAAYLGGTIAASYALSSALGSYQTTAGLSATVATLAANNASYLGGTIASSFVANASYGMLQNTSGHFVVAGTGVVVNATGVHVNSTYIGTISANNATYLGGLPAASYVSSVANINFTSANIYFGNSTTISNVYFQNNSVVYANNRFGTVNQVLSSNGSAMHWADVSAVAVNTFTQYSWSNTQTFTNTISFSGNLNISGANSYFSGKATFAANVVLAAGIDVIDSTGARGTAGQVLTSNGAGNLYWSTVSGTAGATYVQNTDSRTLSGNLYFTGANSYFAGKTTHGANLVLNAGIDVIDSLASRGTAGQVLTSNGAGNVYWSTISASPSASYVQNTDSRTLSGNLNFTGTNTYFTSTAYIGGQIVIGAAGDIVLANGSGIQANGVWGTAGQVLTSDGSGNDYWAAPTIGAAYVQNTDSRTLSGNLNFTGVNNYFTNIYVGANVGANATALYVGNSTVFANVTAGQLIFSSNSTNTSTINSTSFTGTANNATYLGNVVAASYVQNTDSRTLSGNLNFTGANAYFSSKVTHAANVVLLAGIDVIDSTASRGTAGQVLTSNGTGNVYWSTISATPGATYVQNTDSRTLSGNLNFTGVNNYFSTALYVGANVGANATALYVGNSTVFANTTAGQLIFSSNSTNTATINSTAFTGTANNALYLSNVAAASYVQNTDSRTLSGNLNFTGVNNYFTNIYVGANVVANVTNLFVGNSTVNTNISAGNLNVNGAFIANTTGAYHTGTVNAASHTVGATFTANATLVNAAAINITGQVNTATLYASTSANIASAVQANATGVYTTGTVNAASYTVGATFTANATLVNAAAINITGQVNTATLYVTGNTSVGNLTIGVPSSNLDSRLTLVGPSQATVYSISGVSLTQGTDIHISGGDTLSTRITQDAYTNSTSNSYVAFTGRTARGTAASPTQTISGDILSQFTGRGFSNGTLQFGTSSTGRLDVIAGENFTDTSRSTKVVIYTTAVGAINPTGIATFDSNTIVFSANAFAPTMANGTSNTSIATTNYVQNSLLRVYYANGTQAFP
jgi:ribosomal protein L13